MKKEDLMGLNGTRRLVQTRGGGVKNHIFDSETGIWAEIIEIPEYTWEQLQEKLGHEFTIKNS